MKIPNLFLKLVEINNCKLAFLLSQHVLPYLHTKNKNTIASTIQLEPADTPTDIDTTKISLSPFTK